MSSCRKLFSHIYVEEDLLDTERAQAVLRLFPQSCVIPVRRYTDVFSRSSQSYQAQRSCPNLILARKHGTFLYPGAPVCQSFGAERFFYTSSTLNCIYDCDYCWLKGIYSTANIVLFLNMEDFLEAARRLLAEGPLYLSLSYETDMVPLESISHQIRQWNDFILEQPLLTAEIRTKCGNTTLYSRLQSNPRLFVSFTLSPQSLIDACEHYTASLAQRLAAANAALDAGFPVRLCFDPLIRFPSWKEAYSDLIDTVRTSTDLARISGFSVGSYRQSDGYQRRMRKRFPELAVLQYPYETVNGYCQYDSARREEIEQFVYSQLAQYTDPDRIFRL